MSVREANPLGYDVIAPSEGDGRHLRELMEGVLVRAEEQRRHVAGEVFRLMSVVNGGGIPAYLRAVREHPFSAEARKRVTDIVLRERVLPPLFERPEREAPAQKGAFDDSQRVEKEPETEEEAWVPMEYPQFANPAAIQEFFWGEEGGAVA